MRTVAIIDFKSDLDLKSHITVERDQRPWQSQHAAAMLGTVSTLEVHCIDGWQLEAIVIGVRKRHLEMSMVTVDIRKGANIVDTQ